ncbi:glycosyltransferase family 4 protein [Confluentibacter flavum]|uniref:Glycosyltransferase family 1 protein n=1 Tax=Confluentibacter flavum TaxID=1909700 RepID=A0A2N3HGH4_9FLAO|nr:glycosyltransferase family 4 protein [Confluentibacter flavum]PKQ44071.1 glycosyltransferase family 1 protein [Confluentibacter flavum]
MRKKRILMVASSEDSLVSFRGDFIKNLIKSGFDVFVAAPDFTHKRYPTVIDYGAKPIHYKLQRTKLNPFKDMATILELKRIITQNSIDLVFPYTVKPVIYSSIAANFCNVPVISLITGLGFTFTGLTFKARRLQTLNEFLYKISIRKNKVIVFQNSDDYQLFLDRNIIAKNQPVGFVSGSGVNLNLYKYRINDNTTKKIRFLIVARLIKEKGIGLYIEAATILKKTYPEAEFHMIGDLFNTPSAMKEDLLIDLHDQGIIMYHGQQDNVQDHLFKSDVFVLPTYYREGVPRSILEALSVGLPIITTNTPGCKETVIQNENGFLIEPQNLDALINAMEYFLINPSKIKDMGINSRKYAEEKFDVNIINANLLNIIDSVLNNDKDEII